MKYCLILTCLLFIGCSSQQDLAGRIDDVIVAINETNAIAEEIRYDPAVVADPDLIEAIEELSETTKDMDSTDWSWLGIAGVLGMSGLYKRKTGE